MRVQEWPERLNRFLMAADRKRFEWGVHDCCLFAARAVQELTGQDFAAPFYDQYDDALSASRLLVKHGGVRGIATSALGEEIPPLTAGRGDIVLLQTHEHGDTLAVCTGTHCAAPGIHGLMLVPLAEAVSAWRVC